MNVVYHNHLSNKMMYGNPTTILHLNNRGFLCFDVQVLNNTERNEERNKIKYIYVCMQNNEECSY